MRRGDSYTGRLVEAHATILVAASDELVGFVTKTRAG